MLATLGCVGCGNKLTFDAFVSGSEDADRAFCTSWIHMKVVLKVKVIFVKC